MNAAAQRRLTPWLGGILLVLALLFVLLLSGVGKGVRWDAPRPPTPLPRLGAMRLATPLPIEHDAQVWERPLFSSDRHPVADANTGSGVSLGDLELTGIILTSELKMALLRNKSQTATPPAATEGPAAAPAPAGGNEVRVRLGDAVPGGQWTLSDLQPRSAVFVSGSSRTELSLPVAAPLNLVAEPAPASSSKAAADDEDSLDARRAALRQFIRWRSTHSHASQAAPAAAASSRDH